MAKRSVCYFRSDRLRGKDERRRVRRALKRRVEPEPKYSTGRYWTD